MGVASIRRDGFVSIEGRMDPGFLLTAALDATVPRRLTVNLDAETGDASVEVLRPDGQPVAGHSADDCRLSAPDGVAVAVTWRGGECGPAAGWRAPPPEVQSPQRQPVLLPLGAGRPRLGKQQRHYYENSPHRPRPPHRPHPPHPSFPRKRESTSPCRNGGTTGGPAPAMRYRDPAGAGHEVHIMLRQHRQLLHEAVEPARWPSRRQRGEPDRRRHGLDRGGCPPLGSCPCGPRRDSSH